MQPSIGSEGGETPAFTIEWGPVPHDVGVRNGALCGCKSVLIRPRWTRELSTIMKRVRALMPAHLFPRADDDAASLARRLADCDYLDDIHVKLGGHGRLGKRIRLNASKYPQPRRVTFSEELECDKDDCGCDEQCWFLYAYTQFGRVPEDWRCRPMPPPVVDLKSYLWRAAKSTGKLSEYCAQHEPTACQQMIYYCLFKGSVGHHRDNFCHEHFLQQLNVGGTAGGGRLAANAQPVSA